MEATCNVIMIPQPKKGEYRLSSYRLVRSTGEALEKATVNNGQPGGVLQEIEDED